MSEPLASRGPAEPVATVGAGVVPRLRRNVFGASRTLSHRVLHPNASRKLATARYVAIIADGNGRWARARGLPVNAGHDAATDTLTARLRDAAELGVEELTVYAFSTENWSRPSLEVRGLMEMFCRRISREVPQLDDEDIRVQFIGRREGIHERLIERMEWAESLTDGNDGMTLFIALNYGGRAEIVEAARRFEGTTEEEFRRALYAPGMHDPEVIIRTGAERRLSNFLLWHAAYSELVFRDELWPDFTREALEESLQEFARRGRRFGGR
jgi:undecaprenyl diphosphate synthase